MSWEWQALCSASGKPGTSSHEAGGAVYQLVETTEQQQEVISFWRQQFEEKGAYLRDRPEEAINLHSFVYCARVENRIIAACRMTRKTECGWEVSDGLPDAIAQQIENNFSATDFLQLNRVSVESGSRKLNIHQSLFLYCALWLRMHTGYTGYFAVCQPALIKLYKGLGANVLTPRPFPIAGRGERHYYLIAGHVSEAIERLCAVVGNRFCRAEDIR